MSVLSLPRILVAGASSGCGKTTVVCALLTLLCRRGVRPAAFKCGPDYIDPMFHGAVTGVGCINLDPFFCGGDLLRRLTAENAAGHDLAVIEGVMGYYDGTGGSGTENSSYTVARETASPVMLVLSAKGTAASTLAVIEGFANFLPESNIAGVVFNHVAPATYAYLKKLCASRFGEKICPLGYLPKLPEACRIESRHLGLVTAAEIDSLCRRLAQTADIAEATLDLDGFLRLARSASPLAFAAAEIPQYEPIRLAVAKDRAFCFYYKDTLALFEKMGAKVIEFSPLADEPVGEADGLYLGGGYPELYADRLEANRVSLESVRSAVLGGMPAIAECGGFMYLGRSIDGKRMCGVLPHDSQRTPKLVRFGYISLTARAGGVFGPTGTALRGHEFHYFDSTDCGSGFIAEKTSGTQYACAVTTPSLYAGYPHLYLPASPEAAVHFYKACLDYKHGRKTL